LLGVTVFFVVALGFGAGADFVAGGVSTTSFRTSSDGLAATSGSVAAAGTVAVASACLFRPTTVKPVPITTAVAPATIV
jgi:hypothetical protein